MLSTETLGAAKPFTGGEGEVRKVMLKEKEGNQKFAVLEKEEE